MVGPARVCSARPRWVVRMVCPARRGHSSGSVDSARCSILRLPLTANCNPRDALDSAAVEEGSFPVARKSPTVRERRLARALRQFREGAGLTIEEVAEKLEMSASTVSRMETAQVGVRPRDLGFLLDMYKVSEAERGQLLQIEGYARAVLEAIRLDDKPGDIDRRLELRLHRQALLTGEDAPEYWVVLDEAVVRRQGGGPAVMGEELQRPGGGGHAVQRNPPGASLRRRRACRDGRRLYRPPLSRVRRSRCRLHREHRERHVPRGSRGDPPVQQDLRSPAGRGA